MHVADQKGMSVADNLARIKKSFGDRSVKLIAVTKYAKPAEMAEAFYCGVTEFGESRIQDALSKREQLPPSVAKNVNWHFIGHLQTNKAKQAVGNFALIHSVDSMRLANELSKAGAQANIVQPVLLQVKIAEDPNKSGFSPDELRSSFSELLTLPNIAIRGLMTIAPLVKDRSIWRICFIGLKELRDELNLQYGTQLSELSMGMTNDFEEAVQCGATIVRLGRAIFGE